MRKLFLVLAACGLLAGLTATTALAAHPHFNKKDTSATQVGDNLNYTWTLSGLGNDLTSVDVGVQAQVACVTKSGNHPKAANKQGVGQDDTAPAHNGTATNSDTLTPPSSLHCGEGQDLEWLSITFSYDGATLTLHGPF